jgi:hypothetical protein
MLNMSLESFSRRNLFSINETERIDTKRGARYLTGENLKVVWAEFSTLS